MSALATVQLTSNSRFGRYEIVPVNRLTTDGTYQRPLSSWRVRDIVTNYQPILFQPLIVGIRNGIYYVVDGQHRLEAAKELGFSEVPCMLYNTSSVAEEARAFVWLQQFRRKMTTPQKFMARIAYGDDAAIAISELLKKYKFEMGDYEGFNHDSGRHSKNNFIFAIGAVEKAYDEGGVKRVDDLLYVLRNAWDGRSSSLDRTILLGLWKFLADNASSRTALANKLAELQPYDLKLAAMSVGHQYGYPMNEALARVIYNIYKDKRPSAKPSRELE